MAAFCFGSSQFVQTRQPHELNLKPTLSSEDRRTRRTLSTASITHTHALLIRCVDGLVLTPHDALARRAEGENSQPRTGKPAYRGGGGGDTGYRR